MDLNGKEIKYTLRRSACNTNINLKVSHKRGISISAPEDMPVETIEGFIRVNAERILKSVEKYGITASSGRKMRSADDFHQLINKYVYKYYHIIKSVHEMPDFPKIRFRVMKTRWGFCDNSKTELAFNSQLAAKPKEAIEYVVVHELMHFAVSGNSKSFYSEIGRFMPDWKIKRQMLQDEWNPESDEEN